MTASMYGIVHPQQTVNDIYGYSSEDIRQDLRDALAHESQITITDDDTFYSVVRDLNPLQIEKVITNGLCRLIEEDVDIEHYAAICTQSFEMMSDERE